MIVNNSQNSGPVVGLLYNPTVPFVLDEVGDLVQYLAVIPERYWHDIEPASTDRYKRFRNLENEMEAIKYFTHERTVAAHGIGLSLPSAVPLDETLLEQIAVFSAEMNFAWYSEHLSAFLLPNSSIPNAQAGMALPPTYDDEMFEMIRGKLRKLESSLNCPLMLENGSFFTTIPEMETTEHEFMNRLYQEANCGVLLDLHNLYVTYVNGNVEPEKYIQELDPDAVFEIHLAGGDELAGFYIDSHSRFTPEKIWEWAYEFAPTFKNLKAITFEYQETYFEVMGVSGIAQELERMHELAACCRESKYEVAYA
jgi:uncharacterized protein